jgi:hypothetical protein
MEHQSAKNIRAMEEAYRERIRRTARETTSLQRIEWWEMKIRLLREAGPWPCAGVRIEASGAKDEVPFR